jgi:SAM-dependent methyltransferase
LDVVIFAASLHHVPINEIPAALAEARRVLRPGGAVYVSEPAIDDPEDDVLHPLVDERDERAAAQAAIDAADSLGLRIATRFDFDREIVVPDFDEWLAVIVDIETARASALAAGRAEIRTKFERIGRRVDSGWVFRRRSRVALLRAVSAGEG